MLQRISTGHIVMLIAGLAGVLLTLHAQRAADDRQAVLVAARDLPPGTVLSEESLRATRVHLPEDALAHVYGARERAELRGRVVTARVEAGALVGRDDVRAAHRGASSRAMSIALPRANAVAGALRAGDRVDVVAVSRDGATADFVMTDTAVLDVDGGDGGPLGAPDAMTITLAVTPESALALARALDAGTVTLVLATDAAPLSIAEPADG
ncbi:MAG TPA: Flp pilus assembly protein CpaB [Acidimicrobiia bacterium]|nr:Flp pilus assembly protein CpaB [Acidimicrobiia bacterium]